MRSQRPPAGNNQQNLQQAQDDATPDLSIFDRIRAARARFAAPQTASPQAAEPRDGFVDNLERQYDYDWGGADPPKERGLNSAERAAVHEVFGESLDMNAIKLKPGAIGAMDGTFRTIGNAIHIPIEHYTVLDASGEHRSDSLEPAMPTLIHELTHVWQYQNVGPGYMAWGPLTQLYAKITTGDSSNAYKQWRDNVEAGLPWGVMNDEAQGDLVEGYFNLLKVQKEEITTLGQASPETSAMLAKLQPYIDLLRAGKLRWPGEDDNQGSNGEDLDTPMWDV